MEQYLFLALAIAGVLTSDPVSSDCCGKKRVGGIPYTLVDEADTSSYKCLTNCVYEKDDSPGGARFCFAGGYLEVICNEDTASTITATTTPTTTTTTTPRTTTSTTSTVGILIAGGTDPSSTEVFLPGIGKGCTLADLPDRRDQHTLDTVGETGVLCGGGSTPDTQRSCLEFNQATGVWTPYATMLHEARFGHISFVTAEGLLLMGGSKSRNTTEMVDGEMKFPLVQDTIFSCSIQLGSSTIVTGGINSAILSTVSKYNLQGYVEDLPSLLVGRAEHACGSYRDGGDTVLVVAGGRRSTHFLSSTEVHVLGSSRWTAGGPLPRVMYGMASVSLDYGVVSLGGTDSRGWFVNFILSYDNKKGTWKEIGQLGTETARAAATKIFVDPAVCG